jgi:hypothetical protein
MKAGKEHRVPLADAAAAIVEKLAAFRTGDYVFPGGRVGRPISNMASCLIASACESTARREMTAIMRNSPRILDPNDRDPRRGIVPRGIATKLLSMRSAARMSEGVKLLLCGGAMLRLRQAGGRSVEIPPQLSPSNRFEIPWPRGPSMEKHANISRFELGA